MKLGADTTVIVTARPGQYISCDMHAHLVSKAGSLITGKSPSPVFKYRLKAVVHRQATKYHFL